MFWLCQISALTQNTIIRRGRGWTWLKANFTGRWMARRKHLTDSHLRRRRRRLPLHSAPDERNRLWRLSSARSSPFSNTYPLHYPAFPQSAPTIALALPPSAAKERRALRCYIYENKRRRTPTLVVFTLFPVLQLHPLRSGSTLHSSPSMQGCIWHHHFCATMEAVAAEGQKGKGARRQSATATNSLASRTDAASHRMKFSD